MFRRLFSIVFFIVLVLCAFNSNAVTEKGFKSLHTFTKVLNYLDDSYVDPINEEEVIRGAIKGMLMTLDPHSAYMSPEVFRELKVDTAGRFDGVGIEVVIRDGVLTVITPIKGTPAEKAGIEPGDKIINIDGKSTENMNLTEAVAMMRGRRGTKIKLTVVRDDIKKPINFSVVRQAINIPSVKSEVLDKDFGYVNLTSFQDGTAKSLRKAIKELKKKNALHGLILDLRKNPGGLLDQAVDVVNLFINKGIIVTTESRGKMLDKREATLGDEKIDCPMVVLVDGGSASASEIVAGALQENKRAMILGTKTFGKGSVQTVIELDDGSALKLTIARYYTPSGRSIQALGIIPDVEVPAVAPKAEDKKIIQSEESLPGHLEVSGKSLLEDESIERVSKDYQLSVALDYLKSWEIFQREKK